MSRTLHVTETCSAHTGRKKGPAKSETTHHMTRIVLLLTQKVKLTVVKAPHYT